MSKRPLDRELAQEALDAFKAHPTKQAAADALGLHVNTFKDRLRKATDYGLDGSVPWPAADGRAIKGVSTLYDGEGHVRAQWVKEYAEEQEAQVLSEQMQAVFSEWKGHAELIKGPQHASRDMLTTYPISDQHLGLYAWSEEAGEDYDLDIGADLLRKSMNALVNASPASHTALVLVLGDFFHSDTSNNQTARSGNPLDVDTRYAKVVKTGVELLIECITLALQKHREVIVKILPGNHDEHSALCLSIALALFFQKNKRVKVDDKPVRVWAMEFGANMIASTHGDMVKMAGFPGVMAAYWPGIWGRTKYRYGYTGHIHSMNKIEKDGAIVESFQTLSAKDAWHFNSGYSSGRSMVSITLHVEFGEYARCTIAV